MQAHCTAHDLKRVVAVSFLLLRRPPTIRALRLVAFSI
jgi:hypothetical protein